MNEEKTPIKEVVKIPTIGERISNLVLDSLEQHQRFMRVVRGLDITLDHLNQKELVFTRVQALSKVIQSQREIITITRGLVSHRIEKEEGKAYKKLLETLDFLKYCTHCIREADRTKRLDDDFLTKRSNEEGEIYELTPNFREMLEDLETSFEQIYNILLECGILTTTIKEELRRPKLNEI
jgi:hypothetical protein